MEKINTIVSIARALFTSPNFLPYINAGKEPQDVREGGYFCVLEKPDLKKVFLLGKVPSGKMLTYITNAKEKADRIQADPKLLSSWFTRDPLENRYGGGIRAGGLILSFSGLPELADEAFVLSVASKAGLAPISWLRDEISTFSGSDPIFTGFMERETQALATV